MAIPVISVLQMREWEQASWTAGRSESAVISRVGHLVAQRACQMTRPGDLIVVLAGKGHNGDDARQASQNFSDREVYLIDVGEPAPALAEFETQVSLQPGLIIDGLFGIGLNRPLAGDWVRLVEEVNAAGIPILSIDVPSGLNADTGEPRGAAIQATVTLTLAAPKNGLISASSWKSVGRLDVAPDIGLVPKRPSSEVLWTESADFEGYPPPRPVAAHKGTFGHLGIVAGSLGFHGAAVLAARGALQAQPGLVTVFPQEEVYVPVASQLQSTMVKKWALGRVEPASFTALLYGPGLADAALPAEVKRELPRLWREAPIPIIVDASALDWISPGKINSESPRIITPHPGEAGRLLKLPVAKVQADRPNAAVRLSEHFGGCWVVLKGHQTMVARGDGPLFVNSSGNPLLAQGGSGDLLAGYVSGLLAQPELGKRPELALRYAVWQHGAAADSLSERRKSWTVEDLVPEVGVQGT